MFSRRCCCPRRQTYYITSSSLEPFANVLLKRDEKYSIKGSQRVAKTATYISDGDKIEKDFFSKTLYPNPIFAQSVFVFKLKALSI